MHVCGLGKVSHAEFAMASGEMNKAEFTAFLSQFIAAMLPHCNEGTVVDLCVGVYPLAICKGDTLPHLMSP